MKMLSLPFAVAVQVSASAAGSYVPEN